MNVKLISVTPDAEKLVGYCARVSSPNQENPEVSKLLAYCIKHGHWSIFEMAHMVIEITTSRAIAQQILRHRSFSFQEFSQRYAPVQGFEKVTPRRQDVKNRQNSTDDLDKETCTWFEEHYWKVVDACESAYEEALKKGIAKESARFLLPLCTQTKLYMVGSIRSWMTYLMVRLHKSTQKEHRDIAGEIRKTFVSQFPICSSALENFEWCYEGRNG